MVSGFRFDQVSCWPFEGIPLVFPYFAGSNLVPFPQDLSKNPNSGINQVWESLKLRKLGFSEFDERIFCWICTFPSLSCMV